MALSARYHDHMSTPRPVPRTLWLVLGAAGTLALGACATPNNDRLSIGTSDDPVFIPPAIQPNAPLVQADEPSLRGVDRSHWGTRDFIVANDATEHYPHFTRLEPTFDGGTARARGESPTALTALEQEGDFGAIVGEAFAWPFYVVGDAVLLIPRAIEPAQKSPMTWYERGTPGATPTPGEGADGW